MEGFCVVTYLKVRKVVIVRAVSVHGHSVTEAVKSVFDETDESARRMIGLTYKNRLSTAKRYSNGEDSEDSEDEENEEN